MTTHVALPEVVQFLDSELQVSTYPDLALNGLQINSGNDSIYRVAFAVDAGLSVVEAAIAATCQLLVVHHGVFWERLSPLRARGLENSGPASPVAYLCMLLTFLWTGISNTAMRLE